MVADMERYSKRRSSWQREAQERFVQALDEAAAASGLDRAAWHRQSTGDGELAVLPEDVNEALLPWRFLLALDDGLRPYNARLQPAAKIRIRVAFHHGPVYLNSANGFAGTAVNHTARLVDAPPLKAALTRFPAASVACIVSSGVFHQVVVEEDEGVRPERFREVRVSLPEKGFDEPAWVHVVGEDITGTDLGDAERSDSDRGRRESPPAGGSTPGGGGVHVGHVDARKSPMAIGPNAIAIGKLRDGRSER